MFSLVFLALADNADGDSPALLAARLAAGLAARHGAGFAVLHVSGPLGQEGGCVLQLPAEAEQEARRQAVEALLRGLMPPGLTADVMHAAGFVHVEVLKAARILGPDLLVLGGLDAAERCRRELGGTPASAAVLLAVAAPCPALVAVQGGRPASGPFEHVLAVADLAQGEEHVRALLAFAARLAAREGAALTVLHVLPLARDEAAPEQAEMVRRVDEARLRLAYLCKGLPGADRFVLAACEGDPGQEALKQARERKADLLLLAVGGPGPDTRAERVLEGARCPVLLLGPGACAVDAVAAAGAVAVTAASAATGAGANGRRS